MNDTDNTQDRGLTTDQIAAAGTWRGQEDVPQPAGHEGFDDGYADEDVPQPAGHDGFDDGYADNAGPRHRGSCSIRARRPQRPGRRRRRQRRS